MNEGNKLAEAEFFFDMMRAKQENRQEFYYCLSAFLSAARTVLQYACKEAKSKLGGAKWYQDEMDDNVLRFFRDLRDISIHDNPVDARRVWNMGGPSSVPPESPILSQHPYYFNEWQGKADVLNLCHQYIAKLKILVSEGQSKRFLTAYTD